MDYNQVLSGGTGGHAGGGGRWWTNVLVNPGSANQGSNIFQFGAPVVSALGSGGIMVVVVEVEGRMGPSDNPNWVN